MTKATRGVGAVPDSRFGLFGVHYTRTPKEQANGSGQVSVRPGEAGRSKRGPAYALFAAGILIYETTGSGEFL